MLIGQLYRVPWPGKNLGLISMLAFGLTKIPTHFSYGCSHSVFYPITLKCYKALQRAAFHIEGTHPTCWFMLLLLPCNQTH